MTAVAWLLDSCVVSELFKPASNPLVQQWLQKRWDGCWLSAVSVGEIQFGIERMEPGARRNRLQVWFDQLCHQFEGRILPSDEAVWRTWSRLRASCQAMGRPQADLDLLIAATAATYHLTLVTRNTRHFQDTGVRLVNPWSGEPAS